jgi:hypothetical protein
MIVPRSWGSISCSPRNCSAVSRTCGSETKPHSSGASVNCASGRPVRRGTPAAATPRAPPARARTWAGSAGGTAAARPHTSRAWCPPACRTRSAARWCGSARSRAAAACCPAARPASGRSVAARMLAKPRAHQTGRGELGTHCERLVDDGADGRGPVEHRLQRGRVTAPRPPHAQVRRAVDAGVHGRHVEGQRAALATQQ